MQAFQMVVIGAGQTGTPLLRQLLDATVDIIIDVTGSHQVCEQLRNNMVEAGNTHTLIMHEAIALLMMSLSAGRLVSSKHADLEYS